MRKILRCEIRAGDLLGCTRIKRSCFKRAVAIADLGEDCPLRLCKKHEKPFREFHPKIKVDTLKKF